MNEYKLTLEVLHGRFEGKSIELKFETENDSKAREFARASAELKTWGEKTISFGGYEIQKKKGVVWIKISNLDV